MPHGRAQAALAFDLRRLPADFYANPYPTYHALREHAPVHRLPDGGYFLSRYADCVAVYKDSAAYSSDKKREFAPKYGAGLLYEHHTTSLVFNDPPLHTRVRRIIAGALTRYAGQDLVAFPVMGKPQVRENIVALRSSAYEDGSLRSVSTTGSTGTPLTIAQDPGKRQRSVADVIYFNEVSGLLVGDRLMWIHNWTPDTAKPRLAQLAQNVMPISLRDWDERVEDDADPDAAPLAVRWTADLQLDLAHASPPDGEKPNEGHEFALTVVMFTPDSLELGTKRRVEVAFGAPVVDRYGNQENGILACTRPADDLFHLNRASFFFEFLKLDSDEPQVPGELSRLVLTDLHNRAMPMIRYDTGDLVTVADDVPGEAPRLRSLEGRRSDLVYDSKDREVSSGMLNFVLEEFTEISEYQFVQEDAGTYRLRVVPGTSEYEADDFIAVLSKLLGADAHVAVEFVESIPRRPNQKMRPMMASTHRRVSTYHTDVATDGYDDPSRSQSRKCAWWRRSAPSVSPRQQRHPLCPERPDVLPRQLVLADLGPKSDSRVAGQGMGLMLRRTCGARRNVGTEWEGLRARLEIRLTTQQDGDVPR